MSTTKENNDARVIQEERRAWSRRAMASGLSLKGVLFKSFPEDLNRVMHAYHYDIVRQGLKSAGSSVALLEAGCGYGRISAEIREQEPHWRLVGIDSCWEFVCRYPGHVSGEAVGTQGDILWLPFRSESFEAVVVVTCLMYLPEHLRDHGIRELFRVTRKGGFVVVVEPSLMSQRIYSGFGLTSLIRAGRHEESLRTGGVGFRVHDLLKWIRNCNGTVLDCRGNPGFTLMLMPLFLAARWGRKASFGKILAFSALLDRKLQKHLALSTHIGVVAKKEN